ncbi:MAG: GGDEF domain-containing protein [Phycisphaerales bacterium]
MPHEPDHPEPAPQRRVILVGRTGLDQALRRDPAIELIRAADSLDAIGELSDPIDAGSPRESVVVVAPGAEPEGEERAVFLEALRRVDPAVHVFRASPGACPDGYDGVIDPDGAIDEFERALAAHTHNGHAPAVTIEPPPAAAPEAPTIEEPKPRPRAERPPHPAPTLPAPPVRTGRDDTGDKPVLDAVMAGRDPIPPAIELVRRRLGRDDIGYEPRARGVPPSDTLGAPVVADGIVLGHLVVRDAGPAELADEGFNDALKRQADWVSGWIRLHEQQRQLRHAAFTDPLTGAWNRRYFDRYLLAAIDQVRTARLPLTVMVFDIDDFKAYNDRFGHPAGDEILVETVRLLRSVIRPSDRVCRIGGDEFAVIFYEPTGPRSPASRPPESIYRLATRFQKQICEHRFPKLGAEAQGTLTISGGLATYPWDGTDAEGLLARADELALLSKRQGKNVITLGPGAESVCKNDFPGPDEGV